MLGSSEQSHNECNYINPLRICFCKSLKILMTAGFMRAAASFTIPLDPACASYAFKIASTVFMSTSGVLQPNCRVIWSADCNSAAASASVKQPPQIVRAAKIHHLLLELAYLSSN